MRVFHGVENLPDFKKSVVTVGSYDGVHIGHREILNLLVKQAKKIGGESVVITFSPHPREVLYGENIEFLNSIEEKELLLESIGIDNLIIIPFTKEFSGLSPYSFVKEYLVEKVKVVGLVVGFDHFFGHLKEGNFDYLSKLQQQFGFEVFQIPMKELKNGEVSSTLIRELIKDGKLDVAAGFLGYDYFLIGVTGESYYNENNKKILVNIDNKNKILPPAGSYKVRVQGAEIQSVAELEVGNNHTLLLKSDSEISRLDKVKVTFI